jgi:hypothetical protein
VRLWDVLRGQERRRGPNLDNLFAVPGAAVTLQTSLGITPTGVGSVCFRAAEGGAAAATEADAVALVEADGGPHVERTVDGYGFTWLVLRSATDDVSGLVTDLHAVNTALEAQGFATGLLCSVVGFTGDGGARLGLVYLYRRGTFYPFAPIGTQERDTLLERQVRDALSSDLTVESELSRWMPLWGAPGL